jgi:hypothetical protein
MIVWLRRSGRYRAEGPVAVGDVDGLVVGHVVGEAVPQDFEPAVAEGSQGRVVVLAAGALGVVELPGPGGAAQAGEGPLVHRVGQVAVRGVWLWLRDQGLRWPLQGAYRRGQDAEITWVAPAYHAVHTTLTNPAYAGACAYGRTRSERYLDSRGVLRSRRREVPCDQWEVLITGHHEGWVTWQTYLASQQRIAGNTWLQARQPGTGVVREGSAQLQGLASCGICGRRLAVFCDGPAKSTPGYFCTGTGTGSIGARGTRHLRVGGSAIDAAVTSVFLAALAPAALQACLAAAQQLEDGHDTALDQWRRQLEQARYAAARAERRYRSVDPENRLVARGLETEWETALGQLADGGAELARREQARPKTVTAAERAAVLSLGDNLEQVWTAPATTSKDRKQLLRTLLEEVTVTIHRDDTEGRADLLLRWKGGAISELAVPIRRQPPRSALTRTPST